MPLFIYAIRQKFKVISMYSHIRIAKSSTRQGLADQVGLLLFYSYTTGFSQSSSIYTAILNLNTLILRSRETRWVRRRLTASGRELTVRIQAHLLSFSAFSFYYVNPIQFWLSCGLYGWRIAPFPQFRSNVSKSFYNIRFVQ